MISSFLNLFKRQSSRSEPKSTFDTQYQINQLQRIAALQNSFLFDNFPLYYRDRKILIPLLFFSEDRGIYFAEKLEWDFELLQGARVEPFTHQSKTPSTTYLNTIESAIRQKLEDVLSFDATPCNRFLWLNRLKEEEFDSLDPSFHQLLPKEKLIFCDSSDESILYKLNTLAPLSDLHYSYHKIIGSLQSHTLILSTQEHPYGQLLSKEQQNFLESDFNDIVTTLFGEHNSGKSTLIVRKALLLLLQNPENKILIITPTIVGGEILRNELISILEYSALNIEHSSLRFYTPNDSEKIEETDYFKTATAILCDDSHVINKYTIDSLIQHKEDRWLLLSMYNNYVPISGSSFILYNHYQKNIPVKKVTTTSKKTLMTLLVELRSLMPATAQDTIMIILPDYSQLERYKESIDEYFGLNARIIKEDFSLQYHSLDTLLLTTSEFTYGLHFPHVVLIVPEEEENYTYALSRASESATIISFSNPSEE